MNANILSSHYCSYVFEMIGNAADTWEKSEIKFIRFEIYLAASLLAEAIRMIGQRNSLDIDPISFIVESTSDDFGKSRNFCIKFDEDHGACIAYILKVAGNGSRTREGMTS
jgi:hypothetical protein